MTILDMAAANLLSPTTLCFALGVVAVGLRSDLKLPEPIFAGLSFYLMLAIGLKGGAELTGRPASEIGGPVAAALILGCAIPLWCFALLRRYLGLSVPDAAALAAHYGSVSAVTFAAVTTFLDRQGMPYEGFAPALLAIMEVPAIAVAIGLAGVGAAAGRAVHANHDGVAVMSGGSPSLPDGARLQGVLGQVLSSKSIVLLAGGILIGMLSGQAGLAKVRPVFVDLFQGALCLFLLELGRVAASRIGEFRKVGLRLAAFAIVMPMVHGGIGIAVAHAVGLSQGGAVVLGTLAASASYIAAPAAVRLALPDANPAYYLTCSLAMTFPFNLIVGIPLFDWLAGLLYG